MAYFLFKCWHERLFKLSRKDVIPCTSDLQLSMLPIDEDNISWVKDLRGEIYEGQFRYQLGLGDFGYYAMADGRPVGYGWAKHEGSNDYFYNIGKDCIYLCRFFVHESMRGHNVYPAIITELINREKSCNTFYIGVERGNVSSERGLSKVGFKFIREYGFVRGFKHTFNKKTLSK